jgi:hypothetical protein
MQSVFCPRYEPGSFWMWIRSRATSDQSASGLSCALCHCFTFLSQQVRCINEVALTAGWNSGTRHRQDTPVTPAGDSRVQLVISGHNHHVSFADHFLEAAAGVWQCPCKKTPEPADGGARRAWRNRTSVLAVVLVLEFESASVNFDAKWQYLMCCLFR